MKALRLLARHVARERETRWRFALLTTLAYAALLVFCHVHHEFWRDEIHPWTLARLSGFGELVTGDRIYDGHPPGWYWYLRLWTFVTNRSWGLNAATIVAATGAAALFTRYAPLPRYLKVLLLCSYLLGFEYSIMSRNYILGWFLVTVACSLHHPLKSRPILLSLILGALALTSAYGGILALCLYPVILRANYSLGCREGPRTIEFVAAPRLVGGVVLFGALLVFAYVSSTPPDPNPMAGEWDFSSLRSSEAVPALERLVCTFLPVRFLEGETTWSDPSAFWKDHETLRQVACAAVPILACLALAPAWGHLALFVLGVGLMNLVQIARYPGAIRHWGHALILLVALYWVSRNTRPRVSNALAAGVFLIIGAFQAESFCVIVMKDRELAFSGGRETAGFIKRAGLADAPFVAGPDYRVITVTGYLRRPFMSSQTEEINQTVTFHGRRRPYSPKGLVARAVKELEQRGVPVLVVSTEELPPPGPGMQLRLLFRSSARNLVDGERYFVYGLAR